MDLTDIIIIVVGIILLILVLRFIAKNILKIIGVLIIIVVFGYFLLFYKGGLLDLGNKDFILNELKEKYCVEQIDEIKCECIIEPLFNDITSQYSLEELAELQKDKTKSLEIIFKSLRDNRAEIKSCLKEREAPKQMWNDFVDELKKLDIKGKLKHLYEDLKLKNNFNFAL